MIINRCNQYNCSAFSPRMPRRTRLQSKELMYLHDDSGISQWGRGYCWCEGTRGNSKRNLAQNCETAAGENNSLPCN